MRLCFPLTRRVVPVTPREWQLLDVSGNYDLSPEDANQWQVTDNVMGKSVELQLNLVVLKFQQLFPACAKMFDVFTEPQPLILCQFEKFEHLNKLRWYPQQPQRCIFTNLSGA